jgi:hypothetical protein
VLSLALGIGANTAIFQLLNAVRLRSLPVRNPHELAEVKIVGGNHGMGVTNGPYNELTRPMWEEIRRDHPAFSGVFAWSMQGMSVGEGKDFVADGRDHCERRFFPRAGRRAVARPALRAGG